MPRTKVCTKRIAFRVSEKLYNHWMNQAKEEGTTIKELFIRMTYNPPKNHNAIKKTREELEYERDLLENPWKTHPLYQGWMSEEQLNQKIRAEDFRQRVAKNTRSGSEDRQGRKPGEVGYKYKFEEDAEDAENSENDPEEQEPIIYTPSAIVPEDVPEDEEEEYAASGEFPRINEKERKKMEDLLNGKHKPKLQTRSKPKSSGNKSKKAKRKKS